MTTLTIEEAMVFLLRQCDGARAHDSVGFSGVDAQFMHSIGAGYDKYGRLTDKQRAAAARILPKYRKQLEKAGFVLDTTLPAKPVVKPAPPKEPRKVVRREHYFQVTFPYDTEVVSVMQGLKRTVPGTFFQGWSKSWIIPNPEKSYYAVAETLLPIGFEMVDA